MMFNLITIAAIDTGEDYGPTFRNVVGQYHTIASQLLKLAETRPPKESILELDDMEELLTRETIVPKVRDKVDRVLAEFPDSERDFNSAALSPSDAIEAKMSAAMEIQDAAIASLIFLAPPRRSDSYCTIVIASGSESLKCSHRDCKHQGCRGNALFYLPAEDRYLIYLTHHKTCRSKNPVSGGPAMTYITKELGADILTRWLSWRNVLVTGRHRFLFCNSKGDVLKPATLQARVVRWSEEVIGQRMTPHTARFILAEFSVRTLGASMLPCIAGAMGHSVAQLKQYAYKRSMVSRNLAIEAANVLGDDDSVETAADAMEYSHDSGDVNAADPWGDMMMSGAFPSRKKPHGRPKGFAQKYKRRVRPPVTVDWINTHCKTISQRLHVLGVMYGVKPPLSMASDKLLSLLTKPRADDPMPT